MNNKRLGTEFEREMCEILRRAGWWVHFISPDGTGAQPFDIIACRSCTAIVGDCKTSESHIFRIDRLEWNQRLAFDLWMQCGNSTPYIFVKHREKVHVLLYTDLLERGKIDLRGYDNESDTWKQINNLGCDTLSN